MERGWIKLWRKTTDNQVWKYDRTAWHIFEYMLLKADRKTGTLDVAYSTMSEFLKIPKSTLHKAITRLKNAKMVNDIVNDKYTTFVICKFKEYQDGVEQDGERKVNAKGTQSEHIQEVKNKEDDNTKVLSSNDYQIFKEVWKKAYGKYPAGNKKLVDFPIGRLIKAYSLEKVCSAILWAEANRDKNKFIPIFNNPLDLERKWNSLVAQARKEKNGTGKRGVRL